MLIVLIRTLILYALIVFAMRVMGKQQIGQLQPFELVIAIMISELAAVPMENTGIPLVNGITPIMTLIVAQVIISYVVMKSDRARSVICGRPSILIENGRIMETEMRRLRYNLSDLMEQLRGKNIPNIADVEFAVLETNGNLSVIPKSQKRPLTPEDLTVATNYEGLPHPLIMDGHILYHNLRALNLDLTWLDGQLKKHHIERPEDVLFASLDTSGNLFCQSKTGSKGEHT